MMFNRAASCYSETCLRVWGLLVPKTHTLRQDIPLDNQAKNQVKFSEFQISVILHIV